MFGGKFNGFVARKRAVTRNSRELTGSLGMSALPRSELRRFLRRQAEVVGKEAQIGALRAARRRRLSGRLSVLIDELAVEIGPQTLRVFDLIHSAGENDSVNDNEVGSLPFGERPNLVL